VLRRGRNKSTDPRVSETRTKSESIVSSVDTRRNDADRRTAFHRITATIITLCLGLAITAWIFRVQSQRERNLKKAHFQLDSQQQVASIDLNLQMHVGALRSTKAFFAASENVNRAEFGIFAGHILDRLPEIRRLIWAPRITDAERTRHEQLGRKEIGPIYRILERSPLGTLQPAQQRDEYFPVFYTEPASGSAIQGMDVAANANLRGTIDAAIARSDAAMSGRITHRDVINDEKLELVAIVVPVFKGDSAEHRHENIDGLVVAMVPIRQAIQNAITRAARPGIGIRVVDVAAEVGQHVLFESGELAKQDPASRLHHKAEIRVADRIWRIDCIALPTYLLPYPASGPTMTLWAGIIITALLAACAFMLVNRADQKQHLADKRTAERDRFFQLSADLLCIAGFNGYFNKVNPRWRELFGFSEEEACARPYLEFVHPDDREPTIRESKSLSDGLTTAHFENRFLCKDGSYRTILWSAAPMTTHQEIYAVGHDVTDQKFAEQALRESEQRFQLMANHAPVMIWVTDPNGRATFMNDSWLRFTGRSLDQERSEGWLENVHPDDRQSRRDAQAGDTFRIEYRLRRADGAYRWVLDLGTPRVDSDGRLIGFIGSCIDITDIKQIRDELEQRVRARTTDLTEANARLEDEARQRQEYTQRLVIHQNNLRTLAAELALAEEQERQRIASGLHDDIGQQLALFKIQFRSLQSSLPPTHLESSRELQSLLDAIIHSVRSLTFDFCSPTLYRFGILAAIEQLCENLKKEHDIDTNFMETGSIGQLSEAVRITMYQNVRELIHNIVKHARATHVTISVRAEEKMLAICVEDNGVGFDPDQVNPESRTMTGFGLFSIRERLEYLGGKIETWSAPGRGTRVTLHAPMDAPNDSSEA